MRQTYSNIFGKVCLTVATDRKNKWVYNDWAGYLTMDKVKSGAVAYLNAVRGACLSCVLNDNSRVPGSWSHFIDWAAAESTPLAAEAGLKHFAPAKSSAQNFSGSITAFENSVFYNLTEAKGWLGYHSLGAER